MGRISDDEYLKTFNEEKHKILKADKALSDEVLAEINGGVGGS